MLYTGIYLYLFHESYKNHKYRPYYANRGQHTIYQRGCSPLFTKELRYILRDKSQNL